MEKAMKAATLLAGLMVAGISLPAAAQATTSYYIVQNRSTHHCSIVSQKPMATTETVVGPNGVIYKTRTEAMTAMKTVKICTSE
ncbi:MAG: hypothetical protein ACREFB_16450 [Stellaceae bacterium]